MINNYVIIQNSTRALEYFYTEGNNWKSDRIDLLFLMSHKMCTGTTGLLFTFTGEKCLRMRHNKNGVVDLRHW